MANIKAIFTTLFDDYDTLNRAPNFTGWDSILITDKEPEYSQGWIVKVVKVKKDPKKTSRFYKLKSHITLKKYDLVCYIDANMILKTEPPLNPFWMRHPTRSKVYDEIKKIILLNKEKPEILNTQWDHYLKNNFIESGLYQNGFFVRRHSEQMNALMNETYKIVNKFSYRDQVALPFACFMLQTQPEGFINRNYGHKYFRLLSHKKPAIKNKSNVHHITPAAADKNLGRAINQLIENLPVNDWICLRDIDTLPVYHEAFIKQCYEIANNDQGFDLIGCMTNRIGLKWQLQNGMFSEMDIEKHRLLGKDLAKDKTIRPLKNNETIAGFMMLFSKKTWLRAGKFKEGAIMINNSFIDWHFSESVRRSGGKMGVATGVYVFHSYRLDAGNNTRTATNHLK